MEPVKKRKKPKRRLGSVQKEMLGDMYSSNKEWTTKEFGEWLGMSSLRARKSLLLLYKRGLATKRVSDEGQVGRRPNLFGLTEKGKRVVEVHNFHLAEQYWV